MNTDGVSYLHLSDAFRQSDWNVALSAFWSPFFPWILAQIMGATGAASENEASIVHAVQFGAYLLGLLTFEYLLRELERVQCSRAENIRDAFMFISHPVGLALAYSLFAWAGLAAIGMAYVSPDLLVAAELYLLAALLLRFHRTPAPVLMYAAFGATLGVSYLTKTVMFPASFVFLACCYAAAVPGRRRAVGIATATFVFLAFALPEVGAISKVKHRLTFGDSGKIAYARYVNGYSDWWRGEPPGSGIPQHPPRQIGSNPAVYEFATPGYGSYPMRDDPSYWAEGIAPRFDPHEQLAAVERQARLYYGLLAPFFLSLLILSTLRVLAPPERSFVRTDSVIVLPFLAIFLIYLPVYVLPRLVAGAAVVVTVVAVTLLRFRRLQGIRTAVVSVVAILAFDTAGRVAFSLVGNGSAISAGLSGRGDGRTQLDVARSLAGRGVARGERVGVIGGAEGAYWARLSQVQISVEIPEGELEPYWAARGGERRSIEELFSHAGARFIVAKNPPSWALLTDWESLNHSGYYLRRLPGGAP
jgi:hypothetical protein